MTINYASSRASLHSSAMSQFGNHLGYKVRNFANIGRPMIEIQLKDSHGAHGGYVTSYSTMDKIEGNVLVTAGSDTRFEDIEIAFTGQTTTFVDRLTTTPSLSGRTEATHKFMTLKQPINEADLPQPRILQAGKTYSFPFIFVVPDQLLPRACPHRVVTDHVHESHLRLPPSLGDPSLAGHSGILLDDLAPEMSKVSYAIKARVSRLCETDGTDTVIAEKSTKVRVKPAFEEQPPLSVDPFDSTYRLRHEKAIRKGVFKGKLGTLVMETTQPRPLVIPGARTTCNDPITTAANIVLRFDPADGSAPPKLSSLASRIRISTFYASSPRNNFPTRASLGIDLTQGVYEENINLSSMCVASASWKKQDASANPDPSLSRRDSGISDCSSDSTDPLRTGILIASKNYRGKEFYTARLIVPVTLPDTKNFIPTFHTCLISRIYALNFTLSIGGKISDATLSLKVPVQVCAEGSASGVENARARNAEAGAAREADQEAQEMWTPRSVAPPTAMEAVPDLPPGYTAFGNGARASTRGTSVAVMGLA